MFATLDRRWFVPALSGGVAAGLGFFLPGGETSGAWVRHAGYPFMAVLVLAWMIGLGLALREGAGAARMPWKELGGLAGAAGALVVLVLVLSPPCFRVQYDEALLMGTAQGMVVEQEVVVPERMLFQDGEALLIDGFLDKRPWLFPFLVHLVHHGTGYRLENGFLFNAFAGWLLLCWIAFWGRCAAGWRAGLAGVVLLSGVPLFGLSLASAGFEVLNLGVLALLAGLAWFYARRPRPALRRALVLTALACAYCRYESVLFAALALVWVVAFDWRRGGSRAAFDWIYAAVPLAFCPYAWHFRAFDSLGGTFQIDFRPEVGGAVFSPMHGFRNFGPALRFLLDPGTRHPNSLALTLGAGAALVLLWRSRARAAGKAGALAGFGPVLGALAVLNLFILSYFWAQFTDPTTQRIALPTMLLLLLTVFAALVGAGKPAFASAALALALAGWTLQTAPTLAAYGDAPRLPFARGEHRKQQFVEAFVDREAIIFDLSPVPWLADRRQAARLHDWFERPNAWLYHWHRQTWPSWVVLQVERRNPDGIWVPDPRYPIPPDLLILEPIPVPNPVFAQDQRLRAWKIVGVR